MQISDLTINDEASPGNGTVSFTLTKDDGAVFLTTETVGVTITGIIQSETQHQGNGVPELHVVNEFQNVLPGMFQIIAQLAGQNQAQIQAAKPNRNPVVSLNADIVSVSLSGGSGAAVLRSWGSVQDERPDQCMTLVDGQYDCFDQNGVNTGGGYLGQKSSIGYGGAFDLSDWSLNVTAPGRTVVTFYGRTTDFEGLDSQWVTATVEFMIPADPYYSGN